MIQKMYGVRDAKAQAFLQPFFSIQNGSAIRAFSDACNDGKSSFAQHPEDYILYELGSFDDNSGEIMPISPIKLLGIGTDFVSRTGLIDAHRVPVAVPSSEPVMNGDK